MPWKMPASPVPIRWVLLVLGGLALILWLRFAPPTSPWSPRSIAGYVLPEPKVIVKVEKVTVPGPARIKIVPKEVIVTKWRDLPTPATVGNENAVVTAVATIPPSPDGGTAIAVLTPNQAGEGVGTIEYKPATRRFLQVKRDFYAESYYHVAGDRLAEGSLGVNPLRLGPVEIKAKAGIDLMRADSSIKGFVAVGIEYRF